MEDTVSQAKAEFVRSKDRVAYLLAQTPDDRLNWSPAPPARTPLQVGGHVAMAVAAFNGVLDGTPFAFNSIAEADSSLREIEKQFTTREQVLNLLDKNSAAYMIWLDALTPEKLVATVTTPFFTMSMPAAITLLADHLRGHAAQLDYIQTCYGDFDWYVGD